MRGLIALALAILLLFGVPGKNHYAAAFANTSDAHAAGDVIFGELTHYDVCAACCGKTDGITASGLALRNGMDEPYIASCNWLPLGSIVEIDGAQYTVADRGGKELDRTGRLDIFTPGGHQEALRRGRIKGVEIVIIQINEPPNGQEETGC